MSTNYIVTLRRLTSSDIDFFLTWATDREVAKSMTWEAYNSREEAENFLNEVAEKHPWFMAICVDGTPVGSITLAPGKGATKCRAEMGYVIARKFWNMGIGTEAVKLALKRGFTDLKISRIEAHVDPDNAASLKVLGKAGMYLEGLFKNYVIFKGGLRDRYVFSKTI